jgi:hypothetical protein
MLGDVNGDRTVDVFDLARVGLAFGSQPGDAHWNPSADLVRNHLVDLYDIVKVAINLGREH